LYLQQLKDKKRVTGGPDMTLNFTKKVYKTAARKERMKPEG